MPIFIKHIVCRLFQVVVGLGHPIEGTGAMEALAHGCVFLNPKYTGQSQNAFISGRKPTQRLVGRSYIQSSKKS